MLHQHTLVRLCQAREMLRQTGDASVSVAQVAAALGMSVFHFIRLYRAVFGETPKQCQIRARVERAKQLLVLTEASVTEVCFDLGCASLGTFSAAFARRVGMPPSAYRDSVRRLAGAPGRLPRQLVPGCLGLMTAVA
jgi:AraC-like DNA-binding protein